MRISNHLLDQTIAYTNPLPTQPSPAPNISAHHNQVSHNIKQTTTSNIKNIYPQPQQQPNKPKTTKQTNNANQKTTPRELAPAKHIQQQSKRNENPDRYFFKITFAVSRVMKRYQPEYKPTIHTNAKKKTRI